MKQMKSGKRILVSCFLCAMMLIFGLSGAAWADDHLSASSGCTKCHGDSVRSIHDDPETVPVDCDMCHATGGPDWYLNDKVNAMFDVTYGDANPLTLIEDEIFYDEEGDEVDAYEYNDDFVFDFACQNCHFKVIHKDR